MGAFRDTKDFFATLIVHQFPMDYEQWCSISEDKQAAALFVNFFHEIEMAWNRCRNIYTEEEDAVHVLIASLMHNTPIIRDNPSRYSGAYMYRVAYNSILGLTRNYKTAKARLENTICSTVFDCDNEGSDVNGFDTLSDMNAINDPESEFRAMQSEIWNVIANLDEDQTALVDNILSGAKLTDAQKTRRRTLLKQLRKAFAGAHDMTSDAEDDFMYFYEVLEANGVESAVVKMYDGESAVYYGEKKLLNGITYAVFFGPDSDYEIPIDRAQYYIVEDVEYSE